MYQFYWRSNRAKSLRLILFALLMFAMPRSFFGQLDEGAITGTVTDPKGSSVSHATVHLTNIDTNFSLESQTDASGVYTFQPIRIGRYSVTVSAPGFSSTTKSGLVLHVNARLEANVQLQLGKVTETLRVNSDSTPLLQTDESSTGQVMTEQQINDIPLNQRNYVFLAQLSTGVNPSNGSRGQGNGDFNANGQRATENNFILDGVDNNSNSIDFLNGASYNVKPPPDALQEFNVQTADSSAQFGHSAGAVVNASIKSGTNDFHGDAWEYMRNNDFGEAPATQWASGVSHPVVEPYHQNQFGGTVGGPIWKNKAFFFFDYEGNRIIENFPSITSIPTALMLSQPGNFSELLSTANTGNFAPWVLFEPYTGGGTEAQNSSLFPGNPTWWVGTKTLGSACGNPVNVMCSSQIDPIAKALFLAAYSKPPGQRITSVPASQTYNNWAWTSGSTDNTNQWDARVDYNLSSKDQIFGRVSWNKENRYVLAPLGPVFDGGGTDNDGTFNNYGKNAVFSWNHVFSPTMINQARFSYNWGNFAWFQQSYNNGTLDSTYGLGGLAPYSASLGNGGLPQLYVNEFPEIGPPLFQPSPEGQNGYQIIDDATKVFGNHSLKFGVDIQNIRYSVYQPTFGKGAYNFGGGQSSEPGSSFPSGYGLVDFFADGGATSNQGASGPGGTQGSGQDVTFVSNPTPTNNGRWYSGAYLQDDWKVNRRLTLNLGVRYDFFTPPVESTDSQANFDITGPINVAGGGTGKYIFPNSKSNIQSTFSTYSPNFAGDLAADNITVAFSGNRALLNAQRLNFAPRVGASYELSSKLVVRTGFGLYYDGVENLGNYVNLGANFPFDIEQQFNNPGCSVAPGGGINTALGFTACPGNGIFLETGPGASTAPYLPGLTGWDQNVHTPYTMNQNLTMQYAIRNNLTATLGYVGSEARHLAVVVWPDGQVALTPPGTFNNPYTPYPAFAGNIHYISFGAEANYNSLQAKLERRFSNGLSFLGSYTWSHNLDDSREPLPSSGDGGDRMYNVFGLRFDYANSPFDTRERFIFTGTYELPFGLGRKYLNQNKVLDVVAGGWNSTLLFRTQDGNPFTVGSNTPTVGGIFVAAFPTKTGNPFKGGGTPNASNPSTTNPPTTCPAKVRTRANWYNPCAFTDPPLASSVTAPITGAANIRPFLGSPRSQISGPGYERIDMTMTKNFTTYEKQYLQFRADVFNLFNTPSWGAPSNQSTNLINGGQITGNAFLGQYTPDGRFFQLAMKYYF
ncbi:MAG: carboxypeptidase regulatory-like domain-containing protein [Terracidiphilus sp.]